MTEGKPAAVPVRDGDDTERLLGRAFAWGLPVVSVLTAGVVVWVASLGPALLVLASGAMLGTIALLWASLRTLSGDAPLPAGLEATASHRHVVTRLADDKRRVLRALKDLESEHALGKIDEGDYQTLSSRYREEAKAMMRRLDEDIAPMRDEAERLAREYVEGKGLHVASPATSVDLTPTTAPTPFGAGAPNDKPGAAGAPNDRPGAKTPRLECPFCNASNEADATFCKSCGGTIRKKE
ncbi:MAG TPA: zinc ribbon domain-containing protein [Polyangiaceae bacterium]|jgi:hypothetical protein|nr:zinc ribbon domain-containing protein [Polyangiaceae bacterium]